LASRRDSARDKAFTSDCEGGEEDGTGITLESDMLESIR
jgi:hypothetical protein